MSNEGMFTIFRISQQGLNRQMKKLEVTAENIANADKSAGPDGKVYKRKIITNKTIDSKPPGNFGKELHLRLKRGNRKHLSQSKDSNSRLSSKNNNTESTEIKEIGEPKLVYNPDHPLADDNGYVRVSNVNMVEEMVNMMSASRAYDANLSAIEAAKKMADNAMKI